MRTSTITLITVLVLLYFVRTSSGQLNPYADVKSNTSIKGSLFGWQTDGLVNCGDGSSCDAHNPICCTTNQPNPFCIPAGDFCCVNSVGNAGACDTSKFEICCPSSTGHNPCCQKGYSCGRGGCVADNCTLYSGGNDSTCRAVSGGSCKFCYTSHRCMSADSYTATCTDPSPLPANMSSCYEAATCDQCAKVDPSCGWCCETQTCMPATSSYSQCSRYEWITQQMMAVGQCAACEAGGHGLYIITIPSYMSVVFTLVIPLVCGIFLAIICCQKFIQLRRSRAIDGDWTDTLVNNTTEGSNYGGTSEATETTGQPRAGGVVRKYGFVSESQRGDAPPRPNPSSSPTGGAAASSPCPICMERPAEIVFLPCYHAYCCMLCSVQLEEKVKGKRLPCPFCRTPVETMVNVNRIFFNSTSSAVVVLPQEEEGEEEEGESPYVAN